MFGGHRLPGVAFETLVPPAPETLPRMDVALFVGFAEMGPVHRPVAIDDVAGYQRIFGGDLSLSRDPASGETIKAALGPSVRAFFSNGGLRCWVIRLARTEALEARWRRARPIEPADPSGLASAGRFTLPGLIALGPDGLRLARAEARSLGSWSDRLTVAARAERTPFAWTARDPGEAWLAFTSSRPLVAGTLIEMTDEDGVVYAAVDGVDGNAASARWLASFAPVARQGGAEPVTVRLPETGEALAAEFDPSKKRLSFPERPDAVAAERWLRVERAAGEMLFLVEAVAGKAALGAGWTRRSQRRPAADAEAVDVTLGLRIDDGRGEAATIAGIGLTAQAPASWWTNLSDDELPAGETAGTLLLARSAADAVTPPDAWLPLGLEGTFSSPVKALDEGRTALERDGLSRFDRELFLDPELAATRSGRMLEEVERILYVDQRALFGIHGGFAIADGLSFNPVSLIAVPDAVQPGWTTRASEEMPPPEPGFEAPDHWFDHRGPCGRRPEDCGKLAVPHRSRFLDCTTRELEPPAFRPVDTPRAPGPVLLSWSSSLGEGTVFRLEIASLASFQGAEEIYRGEGTSYAVQARAEGFYYFRLRAEQDGEVSAPAVLGFAVRGAAWDSLAPADYSPATLLSV